MFFAHIQYPIIDLRYFLNDELKREIPVFPAPKANTWLRNFGHVRERKTDTSPYYIAENYFCEAHNAVKFEQLPFFAGKEQYKYYINDDELDWIKYTHKPFFNKICQFRRFRSDGNLKSCFEIGLETNPAHYDIGTAHSELRKLFVNVKSYKEDRKIRVPLFELGSQICKLYEDSTSINEAPVKTIYSGSPTIVYIDYDYSNRAFQNYNVISHSEFFNLGFGLFRYNNNYDNCWIIVPWEYKYDKQLLASIRRALLAISLEKEALLSAYNFLLLNAGQDYINENKVLRYIKNTQEKLLRQVRFGIPQSSIVDALFKIDIKNSRPFYRDIINLISNVEDRYILNDFNKLFINIEFSEWKKEIIKLLKTTDDKAQRRKLKQLLDSCIVEDSKKFWALINQFKIDDVIVNIISNLITRLF